METKRTNNIFQTFFELGLSLDDQTGGCHHPIANGNVKKLSNGFYSLRAKGVGQSILFFGGKIFMDTILKTEENFNIKLFK